MIIHSNNFDNTLNYTIISLVVHDNYMSPIAQQQCMWCTKNKLPIMHQKTEAENKNSCECSVESAEI